MNNVFIIIAVAVITYLAAGFLTNIVLVKTGVNHINDSEDIKFTAIGWPIIVIYYAFYKIGDVYYALIRKVTGGKK